VKLPLFETINKMLRKKATWEGLNSKTRELVATLLVCSLYSLVITMACIVAVVYQVPKVGLFQLLGLSSAFAWIGFTSLAVVSNVAGAVIMRVENYQRQRIDFSAQRHVKGMLFARMPTLCVASYRAGNARARRSPSRSHASKDNSADGESDSGGGDPPEPPSLSSLFLISHQTYTYLLCKLNSFHFPWRSLCGPGCRYLLFNPLFLGRGWRK
jgi:hypothetical protein